MGPMYPTKSAASVVINDPTRDPSRRKVTHAYTTNQRGFMYEKNSLGTHKGLQLKKSQIDL